MSNLLRLSRQVLLSSQLLGQNSSARPCTIWLKIVNLEPSHQRSISISTRYYKNRDSVPTDCDLDEKKKSLKEMANETLENIGLKTRSEGGDHSDSAKKSNASKKQSSCDDNKKANLVHRDKILKQFVLDLSNNQVARINYRPIGKNKIELFHTEVPNELRGKGIGKALARGAFECALKENLKLKLSCSFLQDYLERFADEKYKKLVD